MDTVFAGMFSPEWIAALSGILLLDLILSGDNAVLIALACKHLPEEQRKKAIMLGGLGAVAIRIVCTFLATGLLALPYVECTGGAVLLFIAVKLLAGGGDRKVEESSSFMAAVRTILIADFIMSIDNVLSLAGVANTVPQGKWSLIICGIGISIPIVLFGAQFFIKLLEKLPILVYAGAALLGYTSAELIIADPGLGGSLAPYALYLKAGLVVLVLVVGQALKKRQKTAPAEEGAPLSRLTVSLQWDPLCGRSGLAGLANAPAFDLDLSALLLRNGRFTGKEDLVCYENLRHQSGAIEHHGDNLTGNGDGDDELITANLSEMPDGCDRLLFVASIYKAAERNQSFSSLAKASFRLQEAKNGELMHLDLTQARFGSNAVILPCEVVLDGKEWHFHLLEQGSDTNDVKELCESFA